MATTQLGDAAAALCHHNKSDEDVDDADNGEFGDDNEHHAPFTLPTDA